LGRGVKGAYKAALDLEGESGLFAAFFKALPKIRLVLGRVLK
jgi:hypothetical protein